MDWVKDNKMTTLSMGMNAAKLFGKDKGDSSDDSKYSGVLSKYKMSPDFQGRQADPEDYQYTPKVYAEGGIMQMAELPDGLALPAGEAVSLKPGGNHIMLMQVKTPLAAGDATIRVRKAGDRLGLGRDEPASGLAGATFAAALVATNAQGLRDLLLESANPWLPAGFSGPRQQGKGAARIRRQREVHGRGLCWAPSWRPPRLGSVKRGWGKGKP